MAVWYDECVYSVLGWDYGISNQQTKYKKMTKYAVKFICIAIDLFDFVCTPITVV